MRLNNYALLQTINHMGFSGPSYSAVKLLLSCGVRMKDAEQSLVFLKRCHQNNIFPVFIMNSFKFSGAFFPNQLSSHGHELIYKLRLSCLNQNITYKYQFIRKAQSDIENIKRDLHSRLHPTLYSSVISMLNTNNQETKVAAKARLCKKYSWLVYKYYSYEWYDIYNSIVCHPCASSSTV